VGIPWRAGRSRTRDRSHQPYSLHEHLQLVAKEPESCIGTGGNPASNPVDAGAPLTAMALTGHLAQYAGIGGKIEWDAEKMECINQPEFNTFVRREYRKGWEV
jgi:hypothetical protein